VEESVNFARLRLINERKSSGKTDTRANEDKPQELPAAFFFFATPVFFIKKKMQNFC
jgi:hypothetical protein